TMEAVSFPHTTKLTIPFTSARHATIACNSLSVDSELSSDKVQRTISTSDAQLLVTFSATTLRMLRVSINGFMDSLILVTKTLESFE
ncbi:hypothetical protein GGI15_004381, partial [Coemansia interrupta]